MNASCRMSMLPTHFAGYLLWLPVRLIVGRGKRQFVRFELRPPKFVDRHVSQTGNSSGRCFRTVGDPVQVVPTIGGNLGTDRSYFIDNWVGHGRSVSLGSSGRSSRLRYSGVTIRGTCNPLSTFNVVNRRMVKLLARRHMVQVAR
jgi:hypothetical protein